MAWNRPTQAGQPEKHKRSLARPAAIVFAIVVLVATVAIFLCVGPRESVQSIPKKTSKKIARVVSSEARKNHLIKQVVEGRAVAVLEATNAVDKTKNVHKPCVSFADVFYECKYADGRPVNPRPIFKHAPENFIAEMLSETPGVRFLNVELDENFDEQFAVSLNDKIEILDTDSEEDKILKRVVIAAKDTIRGYMEEGAKPSDLVRDVRDEMNKVADYRDNLLKELENYRENASARDVRQFVKEANELLGEYSAMPISIDDEELAEIDERRRSDGFVDPPLDDETPQPVHETPEAEKKGKEDEE